MQRTIDFDEENVIIRLNGLTGLLALKFKLVLPYHTIKYVSVGYFDAPQWMLRMPGTSIPALQVYEGSFKYADEWYFLSYEHRVPLLQFELDGHEKYSYVMIEIDDPTATAAEIRRKLIQA